MRGSCGDGAQWHYRNYREIRNGLNQAGIECVSETDSEVLVQLIAYCFKGNLEEAVSEALGKVKGMVSWS